MHKYFFLFFVFLLLSPAFINPARAQSGDILYYLALVHQHDLSERQFGVRLKAPKVYLSCLKTTDAFYRMEAVQNTLNINIGGYSLYGRDNSRKSCESRHQRAENVIKLDASLLEAYDINVIRFQNGNNYDRYLVGITDDYIEFKTLKATKIVPDTAFHKHRDPLKFWFYPKKTVVAEIIDPLTPEVLRGLSKWAAKNNLIPLEKYRPQINLPEHIREKAYFVDLEDSYWPDLPDEGNVLTEIAIADGEDLGKLPDVPKYQTIAINIRKPSHHD